MSIVCIVPTIRPEQYARFVESWAGLFDQYQVELITVWDGDEPYIEIEDLPNLPVRLTAEHILGDDADLIYNRSDACRNLGFAYVARYMPDVDYILTLDDDVAPRGDTIADHLAAFEKRVPISWLSSSPDAYTRGFPYAVRDEAPVMVSHGVWYGNADWDARTQLENGNAPLDTFYRGPVPKGALFPFCGMNVTIRREVLPYFYFAPMGPKVDVGGPACERFGDIWMGVNLKRALDDLGWALVSGYAAVEHTRASDVQTNYIKEAWGMAQNEYCWRDDDPTPHPYFSHYAECRQRWAEWVENA